MQFRSKQDADSEPVGCRVLQEAPPDDMLAMLQQQAHQGRGPAGEGPPVSLEHAAVAALAASSYDLQVRQKPSLDQTNGLLLDYHELSGKRSACVLTGSRSFNLQKFVNFSQPGFGEGRFQ